MFYIFTEKGTNIKVTLDLGFITRYVASEDGIGTDLYTSENPESFWEVEESFDDINKQVGAESIIKSVE